MEAKIKAFWNEHWISVLITSIPVLLIAAVFITIQVRMYVLPDKLSAEEIGFVEIHENVKYATVVTSRVWPVIKQSSLDLVLDVLDEAEFQEVVWPIRHPSGWSPGGITFYTVTMDEKASEEDIHYFWIFKDIRSRSILAYTHCGKTRYFMCSKMEDFSRALYKVKSKY